MREKRKGYPTRVSLGYKKNKQDRGKVEGGKSKIVKNLKDLIKVKDNELIILGKLGKKKKIELLEKVREKQIKVSKIGVENYLKKNKIKGRKNKLGEKNESKK